MKVYLAEENNAADRLRFLTHSRHRPFIGISVSSRLPPVDKARQILSLALQTPYPALPLLIADEIAYINYRAFKHYSSGNCMKKVQRDADLQIACWQEALSHLPRQQSERVRIMRWAEILTSEYIRQQSVVREAFEQGDLLHHRILALAESFIRHSGKTVTEQRCLDLSEYIIQELPLLLFGIEVDDTRYRMLLYPTQAATPTEMQSLIVALCRHPAFAELRIRLNTGIPAYARTVQLILNDRRNPALAADAPLRTGRRSEFDKTLSETS
ncbi:MAG: tRNA-dependent cyclodipeptide synthase [Gammaproteobacteria bacterium]